MKRILIFCLIVLLANTITKGQIIVKDAANDGVDAGLTELFQTSLIEKLSKTFYVLDRSLGDFDKEIDLSRIKDYFKISIDPNFEPAAYFVRIQYRKTMEHIPNLVDISISVSEVNSTIMYSISGKSIDIEDIPEAVDYYYQYIKYRISAYYPILEYKKDEMITIRYGSDRGSEDAEPLEILSIKDDIPIGEASIESSSSKTSFCSTDFINSNTKLTRSNYDDYYVRSKVDVKKSQKYAGELANLSRDPKTYLRTNVNDWFIFSVETFKFSNPIFESFSTLNKEVVKPVVFGLQYNYSNHNFRIYLKGRMGYSDYPSEEIENRNYSMAFYHLGGGFECQFPIFNLLIPRLGGGVYYMHSAIEKPISNIESETTKLHGMGCELKAGLMLKLFSLGFYGELGYHIIPLLKDYNQINYSGKGISATVGITVFVK
jgi:hypothetical protein